MDFPYLVPVVLSPVLAPEIARPALGVGALKVALPSVKVVGEKGGIAPVHALGVGAGHAGGDLKVKLIVPRPEGHTPLRDLYVV